MRYSLEKTKKLWWKVNWLVPTKPVLILIFYRLMRDRCPEGITSSYRSDLRRLDLYINKKGKAAFESVVEENYDDFYKKKPRQSSQIKFGMNAVNENYKTRE